MLRRPRAISWRAPWLCAGVVRACGEGLLLGVAAGALIAVTSDRTAPSNSLSVDVRIAAPSFVIAMATVGVFWYALRARLNERWDIRGVIRDLAVGAILAIPIAVVLLIAGQDIARTVEDLPVH